MPTRQKNCSAPNGSAPQPAQRALRSASRLGFSLVELLVVIAIMAILSVTAYTAFGGQTVKARDAKRVQDLDTIQGALQIYYVNEGKYPAAPLTSGTNIASGEIPKSYLSNIPVDPGSAAHDYAYAISGNSFELGATLEKDGTVANYEAYVVGNSDISLLVTSGGFGRYNNAGTLTACTNGRAISNGTIGAADADDNCIPYDPAN